MGIYDDQVGTDTFPAALSEGGPLAKALQWLVGPGGGLAGSLGMPSAMEQSAALMAAHPYRPGISLQEMLAGRTEDPVASAFQPGMLGTTYNAFKGYFPYDWRTMPVKDWRGNIIEGADRIPQPITEINSPGNPWAGFFSDDPKVASRFAEHYATHGAVYPARVTLDNPVIIDANGKPSSAFQFEDMARMHGTMDDYQKYKKAISDTSNDGVIIKNTNDEGTVYIPRGSHQIRSIFEDFFR